MGEFGFLSQAIALNPIVVGGNPITDPDGRLKLNLKDWTWGYNLGVLIELSSCTRFGVTYRSQLDHDFSGKAEIIPSGFDTGIDTRFQFAQWVVASFFHQLNPRLAVMGSAGWDDWSALKRTVLVSDNGGTFTIPRNWQDTWHGSLGAEYKLCYPVTLQAGVSYDSSPTRASSRTPDLPMDEVWRFGTGLIWQCNACEKLSTAIEYAYFGKAPIDSVKDGTDITLLKGHYRHNNLIFINFTYQRTF